MNEIHTVLLSTTLGQILRYNPKSQPITVKIRLLGDAALESPKVLKMI